MMLDKVTINYICSLPLVDRVENLQHVKSQQLIVTVHQSNHLSVATTRPIDNILDALPVSQLLLIDSELKFTTISIICRGFPLRKRLNFYIIVDKHCLKIRVILIE